MCVAMLPTIVKSYINIILLGTHVLLSCIVTSKHLLSNNVYIIGIEMATAKLCLDNRLKIIST